MSDSDLDWATSDLLASCDIVYYDATSLARYSKKFLYDPFFFGWSSWTWRFTFSDWTKRWFFAIRIPFRRFESIPGFEASHSGVSFPPPFELPFLFFLTCFVPLLVLVNGPMWTRSNDLDNLIACRMKALNFFWVWHMQSPDSTVMQLFFNGTQNVVDTNLFVFYQQTLQSVTVQYWIIWDE